MSPLVIFALAAVFFGILGVGAALAMPGGGTGRDQRVKSIDDYLNRTGGPAPAAKEAGLGALQANLNQLGQKVMGEGEKTDKVMVLIEQADLPLRSAEWGVVRIVSAVVGLLVGVLLLHGGPLTLLGLLFGGLLGVLGPNFVLKFLAGRRKSKFEKQMPDVLMLVASSLSTGFSLMQALDAVAVDVAEPSRKEFSRVMAESRIGVPIEDSLNRMADRMDSDNMRWTAMAIGIQRQVGGNLAETLRKTSQTLRDRESLRRQVRALSAEGRLSAYILIALPVGLFLFLTNSNREYIQLLWTHPIGMGMLAACVVNMVLGLLWMNKLVKVEV